MTWGETPRYFGHTDVPLNAEGIRQGALLVERLRGERLDAVYSSDLARCLASAAAIATSHTLPVLPDADLREINFGEFEGLSFAEIDARFPGAERFWGAGVTDVCFPGGESVDLLATRVDRFLARIAVAHRGDERVLVVGHGGPLKLMLCRALGLTPIRWWQLRLDLASLSVLDLYPEGAVVSRLNDVCHLEPAVQPFGVVDTPYDRC